MATTAAPTNSLDALIASLAKSFAGGTGTETRANSSSSSTTAFTDELRPLLDLLTQQAGQYGKEQAITDSSQLLQTTAQNILRQQMPSIANAGRGAGMYNSTTQQQLLDNLQGQTTANMAQVLQDQILKYAQIQQNAGNTAADINNSTREQVSQSTQTSTSGGSSNQLKAVAGQILLSQGLGALRKAFGSENEALATTATNAIGGITAALPTVGTIASPDNLSDTFWSGWLGNGSGSGALPAPSLPAPGLSMPDLGSGNGGGLFDNIIGGIGDTIGNIGSGVGDFLGGIGSGIVDTVGSIGSGIGDFVGGVGDTIGDAWSGIGGWTGWWANGGRIPGAEAAGGKDNLIAGVGGGEVILPLDTVKALDKQLGEDWVDRLISATHKEVNPKPTAKAQAMAARAVSK